MAVTEARILETDGGPGQEGTGWFVVNVDDTMWWRNDVFGASCPFEANEDEKRCKANVADARFQGYGINIHVVSPGRPTCMCHGEDSQEAVLVLHGECPLLVEGRERPLKPWDFVHFPPWTEHVIVGAGVEEQTRLPRNAYARFPEWERVRLEDVGLPWQ